jgi:two-component system invasion response regulator UvrY
MKEITILLVDDHKMVTNAIASLLNDDGRFNVVGEAADYEQAICIANSKKPEIVMIEIRMDSRFDIIKAIWKYSPCSKIIALTVYNTVGHAKKLMSAGGMGYVTKNSSIEEFLKAIVEVHGGRKFFCSEIKDSLTRQVMDESIDNSISLTQKELEVISYIKQGFSSREIGELMYASTKTIEVHRYNILKKLKLKNVAELVNYINMQGL